jgi:hypothetical protein
MPAPAAGEAEPKGVIEKAKEKVKSLLKTDESADTDALQETDEPAAAAPAAAAMPKVAVEEAADEAAAAEDGEAEEVAAEDMAAPIVAAPAVKAVQEMAAEDMAIEEATAPAAVADPTTTMPAPAAGEAEPKGMIEKATDKVKSLLNSDAPAAPETE